MPTVKYIGTKPLTFVFRGKRRVISPGQILTVPQKLYDRVSKTKLMRFFEIIDTHEERIKRLERVVLHLVKEVIGLGGSPP